MPTYPRHTLPIKRRKKRTQSCGSNLASTCLSSVGADELGYALAIFVAAANGQLTWSAAAKQGERPISSRACEKLFWNLTVANHREKTFDMELINLMAPVHRAFIALWNEYTNSNVQHSVSARVLGFYYLMERTKGRAVKEWSRVCDGNPESILLHPAVVEVLASIPLSTKGELPELPFLARVFRRVADLPAASTDDGKGLSIDTGVDFGSSTNS